LARLIISLVGSRSRLEFRTLPPDDPRQRYPDVICANQLPHWSPRVPFEEGLERTIAYFDGLLSSPGEAKRLVWKVTL
jgi:UDP-glucuronate decarboxylase